jgi:hypothetical protein
MKRALWVDGALGVVGVALKTTVGVISAHVSPAYRHPLYALCAALAVVTLAQTMRAVRNGLHHEREFAKLHDGQAYLAQPEINRQFDMLFQRHRGSRGAIGR